jgi:hypothetical protein
MIFQQSNNSNNEEEIRVLYNDCYGKWAISNKFNFNFIINNEVGVEQLILKN